MTTNKVQIYNSILLKYYNCDIYILKILNIGNFFLCHLKINVPVSLSGFQPVPTELTVISFSVR